MTDTLTRDDIQQLCAIALPGNIALLEHQYDIPGPKVIMPVDGWQEAIDEAAGRDCGILRGVDGGLYLVIPVEIVTVSVIRHGDVIEVREVTS